MNHPVTEALKGQQFRMSCDGKKCRQTFTPKQFVSVRRMIEDARALGWRYEEDSGKCLCPVCETKRKKNSERNKHQ